jgi:type VI secretion system protein ImpB
MAQDQSVAPQERVNITYTPATGDRNAQVELPLKMLFVGDYTGRPDPRPLEERKPVNINKDNFQEVLEKHKLEIQFNVADRRNGAKAGAELPVKLRFSKLSDFTPDEVAKQIPELAKRLELRAALSALKGPLTNTPAFRKKLEALVGDDATRKLLAAEVISTKEEG